VCTCISPQARTRGWASSCIASRRTCASSQVATGLGPHDMGIGVHIHIAPSPTWLGSTPTTSPTTVNAQPRTLKSRQVSSSLVKSRQVSSSLVNTQPAAPSTQPLARTATSGTVTSATAVLRSLLTVSLTVSSYGLVTRHANTQRQPRPPSLVKSAPVIKISSKSARGVG